MGITKHGHDLMVRVLTELGPGSSVCELGDQYITFGPKNKTLARDYFMGLKYRVGRYESLEGNGKGTALVDLNELIDNGLPKGMWIDQFDLVTDFGTGEHIFDQRAVWENIHNLTKPSCYIIFERPTDGYYGHGFYLLSPPLILDLAYANNYDILEMEYADNQRGRSLYGLIRMPAKKLPFKVPQQARYFKDLLPIMDKKERARGPMHKGGAMSLKMLHARFRYDNK